MANFTDISYLLSGFNLTGNPAGTLTVPGISLLQDEQGQFIITYTQFLSAEEVAATNYYNTADDVVINFVNPNDFHTDIVSATESILNPNGAYSVLFSDVAMVQFSQAENDTGIITFGQLTGNFPPFTAEPKVSAGTFRYSSEVPILAEAHGDIWINMDHGL